MIVFKCKMCGGTIEFEQGATVGVCDSCGTQQTLPRLDDDRKANLYDRANHFRRNNDFDKAMGIYEQILNEDKTDAEAYWSLVLCRYGIEYVEDPSSHKRIPTVNRAQFTSVLADADYKSALEYADGYQRQLYEEEAKAIDEIQKGILAISSKEEPFDVFICYKESDTSGRRTPDSVLAQDLYYQLKQEGFKVFFARITLEDKLGSAYEPYIFAALNSAKVMVVLGTRPEFFTAVWVKNEWSRYLALIKNGAKKMLIPAYKDMDPYDLPEEFSHLQAQDMSKLGFMQDLIRGIKKIVNADEPKAAVVKETVIAGGNASAAPLLKRAFIFLEDSDWQNADEYCEKVLDIDPENALGYVGKLMVELHVRRQDDLKDCADPFDEKNSYQKALRYADDTLRNALEGYIEHINTRNENARLEDIYKRATLAMEYARKELDYKDAVRSFKSISGYKDADELYEKCLEKAETARKDEILAEAKKNMNGTRIADYETAIKLLESIAGWQDADEKCDECQRIIDDLRAKEKAAWIERDRQAKRRARRKKRIAHMTALIICVMIAATALIKEVIIPSVKYNNAIDLMEKCKYNEAIDAFEKLDGFWKSEKKISECETSIIDGKYDAALALMSQGQYEEAIVAFEGLDGYKDSAGKISECETAILDGKYDAALALMSQGQYEEAIVAFKGLSGYKDSAAKISECEPIILDGKYNAAIALIGEEKFIDAYEVFIALDGYKDSDEKAQSLYDAFNDIEKMKFREVKVGESIFFGNYEQDNNTSNGKEEIEWRVLEVQGSKVLIISCSVLDYQVFGSREISTWENSKIRSWLNNEFISNAFFEKDLKWILTSEVETVNIYSESRMKYLGVKNEESSKEITQDKLFLLSLDEVNRYFDNDVKRQCRPTQYADAQFDKDYSRRWVLRSSVDTLDWLYRPDSISMANGDISKEGTWADALYGIRPAMWIDLNT